MASHLDPAGEQVRPVQIVDLFAGPGGVDVAAEKLGIATVGVEWGLRRLRNTACGWPGDHRR